MDATTTLATVLASLLTAAATFAGVRLSQRAQRTSDQERADQAQGKFLVEQRQWAEAIYDRQNQLLAECEERCAQNADRLARECAADLERLRRQADRQLNELRVQTRAQVLVAQARERYWWRAAAGQPIPGEPPPPVPPTQEDQR